MTLYDRIKKIADDKNITISYIEENVQISNGAIIKWKRNIPRADSLYKVAKFLGCSVEFLMSDNKDYPMYSDTYDGIIVKENTEDYKLVLNENEIEIIDILRKFKDYRTQIKFIARVEVLADEMLANIEENKK